LANSCGMIFNMVGDKPSRSPSLKLDVSVTLLIKIQVTE
jgi:hypothetical protein